MKPKKYLGQNFLMNKGKISELLDAAEISRGDVVLEIGPGTGNVSEEILKLGAFLLAVELDKEIIPELSKRLESVSKDVTKASSESFEIVNEGALWFLDNLTISKGQFRNRKITKIAASLPYQITSPILHRMVFLSQHLQTSALIIQKEVAERVCAAPPDSNYMASFIQTFFDVEIVDLISREDFSPAPRVDSAIISLTPIKSPLFPQTSKSSENTENRKKLIEEFSKFLHHGFRQQRKMLNKRFERELLEECDIDLKRRPETLTINEWLKLFRKTKEF